MNILEYEDSIYGPVRISEPVLFDLIADESVQRLKHIDQYGYQWPFIPGQRSSRFSHSLGVCILLKKFGASLAEQIAGLIHDVSHAAFSHSIDYVLTANQECQSFQDDIFNQFINKTNIPKILSRHGFEIEYILNDSNFPLKEKILPNLCADRIDYTLRDALVSGELAEPQKLIQHLSVVDNEWIFDDAQPAKQFADLFLRMNDKYYSGIATAKMQLGVGRCLRYAVSKGYLTKEDLFTTDNEVIKKIKDNLSGDADLRNYWALMNNKVDIIENSADYDERIVCKSRAVDPKFMENGAVLRVSDKFIECKKTLLECSDPKVYFLKFNI